MHKFSTLFSRLITIVIDHLNSVIVRYYGLRFKKFGSNNRIAFPLRIYGKNFIKVGNNCSINAFVHVWGNGGIEIGNEVMIAAHVTISSLTHNYNSQSMRFGGTIKKKNNYL